MNKEFLIQYAEIREEIKDLKRRKDLLEKKLQNLESVTDFVKGTRRDGTYGSIRITGYPVPDYYRKKAALELYYKKLEEKETELLEAVNQVEEYIETIDKSELRIIFRLSYIDNLSDIRVADRMNQMFPNRKIKYTDENIKKRRQRFLEKVENVTPCPETKC